jgi:carbonic anhydrase
MEGKTDADGRQERSFRGDVGREERMIPAARALERLRDGNRRFVSGERSHECLADRARRQKLLRGQNPSAVILGCSDSRVPAEIVFDQGLGDLFVIRVAGNIAASSQVGSVEFAATQLGTRLVVVLGHSHCGAVQATLEAIQQPGNDSPRDLHSIVEHLRPAVESVLAADAGGDREALLRRAGRANVRASADHLRRRSAILGRLIREDGLLVVGAEYSLETGVVDFFDGVPATGQSPDDS